MKPWELSPGGAEAPAKTTTGQPWERDRGGVDAPTQTGQAWQPPQPAATAPDSALLKVGGPKPNPLTHDEHKQYQAFSQRNALARLDAENFEMEMRRDFAERRFKRLQGA